MTDSPFSDFRTNKPSDVVSTLVSIYDSKDLFVKELQSLLAQRLLLVRDGNYEKEVCHLVYRMLSPLMQRHTENECRSAEASIWRRSLTSLRRNAEGHDRLS